MEVGGVGNTSIAFLNKVVVNFGKDIGFSSFDKVLGKKKVAGFGWIVSNHAFDLDISTEFLIEKSKAFQSTQGLAPGRLVVFFSVSYVLSDPRASMRFIATHEFNDSSGFQVEKYQRFCAMTKGYQ